MNALDRAMSYLNIRARSCHEMTVYLRDKGYSQDEIDETIKQLIEYKYLDDANFAKLYIEYSFAKGRGQERIKRELREKGVDTNTIEDAFYELEDEGSIPDQLSIAIEIGRDVIGSTDISALDYQEKRKLEAKIGRRLASRGFGIDVIYSVIKELKK